MRFAHRAGKRTANCNFREGPSAAVFFYQPRNNFAAIKLPLKGSGYRHVLFKRLRRKKHKPLALAIQREPFGDYDNIAD